MSQFLPTVMLTHDFWPPSIPTPHSWTDVRSHKVPVHHSKAGWRGEFPWWQSTAIALGKEDSRWRFSVSSPAFLPCREFKHQTTDMLWQASASFTSTNWLAYKYLLAQEKHYWQNKLVEYWHNVFFHKAWKPRGCQRVFLISPLLTVKTMNSFPRMTRHREDPPGETEAFPEPQVPPVGKVFQSHWFLQWEKRAQEEPLVPPELWVAL